MDRVKYFYGERFDFKIGSYVWTGTGTRAAIEKRGHRVSHYIGEGTADLIPSGWKPAPIAPILSAEI